MRELIDSYTSTGLKLLHHGIGKVVSCHISPTSRCDLRCEYCSVANREKHELTRPQIMEYLDICQRHHCRAVIITGGGEPLMYEHIDWLVRYLHRNHFLIGLITNGTLGFNLTPDAWQLIDWVRISYTGATLRLPRDPGPYDIGFSVVDPTPEQLQAAEETAMAYKAEYLRVVPDCRPGREPREYEPKWDRTFIQPKQPRCPQVDVCYQAFIRPYLHESGVVYPCDSVTLHEDRQVFDPKYKLCELSELSDALLYSRFPFKPRELCTRCVFADTVEMLDRAMKVDHVDFV